MNNTSSSETICQPCSGQPEVKISICPSHKNVPHKKPFSSDILDYEKALRDTPPQSPAGILNKNDTLMNMLDVGRSDSLDEIIMNIEASLQMIPGENSDFLDKQKPKKHVSLSEQTTEPGDGDQTAEFNPSKPFEKAGTDLVKKSYMETKELKSFLSLGIKEAPSPRDTYYIRRGELRTFKVYFFTKDLWLFIPLNVSLRVFDIIDQCLDAYRSNRSIDQSLLKFPNHPSAYNLKLGNNPNPLDKKIEFKTLKFGKGIEELMLTEIPDFERQNKGDEAITVIIFLSDEGKTKIIFEMESDNTIKDISASLTSRKIPGYTPKTFNIQVCIGDSDNRSQDLKNCLAPQIPLKALRKYIKDGFLHLKLVKKKFADEPAERNKHTGAMKEMSVSPRDNKEEDQIFLYNEVSANHYEEFEVIKINDSGRRQIRVLGIDGFKIYNYTKQYKQEQQQGESKISAISEMLNSVFYSKFGTMHPEWLICNINKIETMDQNGFMLEMKLEGNNLKRIVYNAPDKKMANQIVAKLRYLKNQEAKGT